MPRLTDEELRTVAEEWIDLPNLREMARELLLARDVVKWARKHTADDRYGTHYEGCEQSHKWCDLSARLRRYALLDNGGE